MQLGMINTERGPVGEFRCPGQQLGLRRTLAHQCHQFGGVAVTECRSQALLLLNV